MQPTRILLSQTLQPETRAWLARVATAGGSVSGTAKQAVDKFVKQSKGAGIWSMFRRVNLCCGDFTASFVPLVNTSGSVTDTNNNLVASDYDEGLGWQTNGTTKYINTGYTPNVGTGGLAVYLRTNVTTTQQVPIGLWDNPGTELVRIIQQSGTTYTYQWGDIFGVAAAVNPLIGFCHGSRRAANDIEIYRNGVSLNTDTTSRSFVTPSIPITVFCQNRDGGAQDDFCVSGTRISGYSIDSGMSDSMAAAYNQIMQTFQRALGRAV